MTAVQKLKWAILNRMIELIDLREKQYGVQEGHTPSVNQPPLPYPSSGEDIERRWKEIGEEDVYLAFYDAQQEIREGMEESGVSPDYSRHYESKAVAMQFPDQTWVGWTYWYGGGKHGEPEAVEWIENAYDLEMIGEEQIVRRIFQRKV